MIEPGDRLPAVILYNGSPSVKLNTGQLCAGKRVLFVGVPGAFTPVCHGSHIPGYLASLDRFAAKGVHLVVCFTVNDPFVTRAWRRSLLRGDDCDYDYENDDDEAEAEPEAGGRCRLLVLSDCRGDFSRALGMSLDLTPVLGSVRCRRFALFAVDNEVRAVSVEADNTKVEATSAERMLSMV